ncbi:MAG TPA: MarR family winged helix-turn-helix transcriptional regulator [Acidimicrobiales bacterium]|nr:MarR family winged helix-turn-helix transcriptional regulator [Acidimicrobiales bacterium]
MGGSADRRERPAAGATARAAELAALDLALARVRRLWDNPAIKRWFQRHLGQSVEPSVIRTLRAIEWTGDRSPGVREVASALGVGESAASRFVDAAVAAGYVDRAVSGEDRRRCVLSLTAAGSDLVARAAAARTALLARVTGDWSPEELSRLAALLDRFTDAVAAHEADL